MQTPTQYPTWVTSASGDAVFVPDQASFNQAVKPVAAGGLGGYALARLAGSYFSVVRMPGAWPVAASVLVGAAVAASVLPAARAARVDVIQVLRSE